MVVPKSEFSEDFVQKMRDRMEMSFHKYGKIEDAYPDKVDAVQSGLTRIDRYIETGNKEFLVDAANFFMIEFMLPRHKNAHYTPLDSNKGPGRFVVDADKDVHSNNKDL